MKIKKLPIIKEFEKLSIDELKSEKERLKNILHEEFDLMLDGMADVKGYKNDPHLTVRKSIESNWVLYQNYMIVLHKKNACDRIWNDDCSNIKVMTEDEFDKMVKEGNAIRYNSSATDKKDKKKK